MSKIIKFLCMIVIIFVCICTLRFVLTIDTVDAWLNEKLGGNTEIPSGLIYAEHYNDKYGVHESDKPCICFFEEKLYMVVGDEPIDITPEGINISYFGKITDFNETISYKKNCLVSEDGKYIVYVLYFKDFPYLYYLDIQEKQSFLIAEKVDSFDIVENDGKDTLTVVYATGYDQHNELFVFSSKVTQSEDGSKVVGGDSELVCENIKTAGVFESYGKVVYLDSNKELFEHDFYSNTQSLVSKDIEKVYFPQDEYYNYDDYYKDFTVCAMKNGKDYILNGKDEVEITKGYYNIIPKYTFKCKDGGLYYYSNQNKKIVSVSGAGERILYSELGNVYGILGYYPNQESGKGYFIAALEDSLYLLYENGNKAQKLSDISSDYKKNAGMIEKHLRVYKVSDDTFYINHLVSGSLILNNKNTESWIAGAESYNYGLTAVRKTEDGFESEELNIPPTRKLSVPTEVSVDAQLQKAAGNLLYVSYFEDGTVKAVSLLGKNGRIVKSDILASAAYSKEQCNIKVFPSETGTYFLREFEGNNKEFLFLRPNETRFDVAVDKNGEPIENYDEFSVAVSFGKLVIF